MQMTQPSNFVELLRDQAQRQPAQVAYIALKNGEKEDRRITYGELDQQARAIATHLTTQISLGERALLVYPYESGIEFITAFLGCLYAGIVAVPSHPPRSRYTLNDLSARLETAKAKAVLSTQSLGNKLKRQLSDPEIPASQMQLQWITPSALPIAEATDWKTPDINGDTLAFLQYTSGSTGTPKGVMIDHRCLLYNQQVLQQAFGHSDQSIGVGWLPLFHDMGLIGNALQALYLGTSCILMSPIDFIQKPIRWLRAISHYGATTSGGPNFAYDLLCKQVKDEQLDDLDLSRWQVAFSGAEAVKVETMDRFAAKFERCGFQRRAFYSCYGMAEATLFITGGEKAELPQVQYVQAEALEKNQVAVASPQQKRARALVSCGRPWLDGKVAIANPNTLTRCPPDQVGEIWFSSAGLGQGYWQQPDLTERTFQARLETGEGPFLRTGDLGFMLDGHLFITGRLHDVLVFWGLNHYPHHIEHTVSTCHPGFSPDCAAFSIPVEGQERLVIAQEVQRSQRRSLKAKDIAHKIHWVAFEEHFVDVHALALINPGGLPKTPSGKIQRSACRQQFLDGTLKVIDEWRSPPQMPTDIPGLMRYYFNPLNHLKRYIAQAQWP
ncbi:Putative fatty-acid--CoA ligase FadD21 [Acaryochloris thomasi RCC1774]|uniref:Fatty-acid--CoA ligase FadD21 n=1 Tax=Acaryochloris thomasi RCC1774 TaxID=1764569 RepID=A0A2W1JGJ2_9CYAN|nr:fatty acyl-AMP ligase [Acaryochloris thomasi]PZD72723.1 Putative fatty-acid--CoA ligase FadD21 [Acaryochloris thomasi RCC1774]